MSELFYIHVSDSWFFEPGWQPQVFHNQQQPDWFLKMPGYPQELPRQEERLYFPYIRWCSVQFDLHKPIALRTDFSQAANMKGLFPRLQHRSLQSMNDLFSLLNQTECCHFHDPENQPNIQKRGFRSTFFIFLEMIILLFLQKHSILSDELCSLSIDPFYRLSYC